MNLGRVNHPDLALKKRVEEEPQLLMMKLVDYKGIW